MKYLLMIYLNPESRAAWEAMPEEVRAEGMKAHAQVIDELTASGEFIVSEALADSSVAKRVAIREGGAITTDGPFGEVKEFLAGFYLVECDSFERALECAAKLPEAPFGEIEVRPIMDYGGSEM
jgi:hypothetical protein